MTVWWILVDHCVLKSLIIQSNLYFNLRLFNSCERSRWGQSTCSPLKHSLHILECHSHFWAWSQTVGHVHPFSLQHQTPGEIWPILAKTSWSAPEHNSRCQISAMTRGGIGGHTRTHTPDRQTDNANTHRRHIQLRRSRCFISLCVCEECSAPSDRGVLISEAGSSLLWAGPLW